MIRTVYRRPDASTTPGDAFVGVDPLDPLTGAVPTWRLDEEPLYLECVRDLGVPGLDDPVHVDVEVEVVEVGMSDPSQVEDDVEVDDAPPTPALRLVESVVEDEPAACPDCSATGLDPCRPKRNPAGSPLPRWHTRRRRLLERDAGRGGVLLLVLVVLVVLAVAGGAGAVLRSAVEGVVDGVPACSTTSSGGLGAGCAP